MFEVKDHQLCRDGNPVVQVHSPNRGVEMHPSVLVMHYTGSSSTGGAIRTLTDGEAANRVSAHLVISPEGVITQLVPFNLVAWHAGISVWRSREFCNNFSIGIEMVNSGLLGRAASGTYYDRLTHKHIDPRQVALAEHKHGGGILPWEIYPVAQIDAAIAAATAIVKAYDIKDIAGHDDISPGRKIDPGPAWPMVSFTSRVHGRQ